MSRAKRRSLVNNMGLALGYAPLYSYCKSLRVERSTESIVSRASKMAASMAVENMVSSEIEEGEVPLHTYLLESDIEQAVWYMSRPSPRGKRQSTINTPPR